MADAQIHQGSIIVAQMVPSKGPAKVRFAVVYTDDKHIQSQNDLDLVAISASSYPDDPDSIALPWHPDGNCMTRLRKPCAVALRFTNTLPKSQLRATTGYVPRRLLAEILDGLKRIGKI